MKITTTTLGISAIVLGSLSPIVSAQFSTARSSKPPAGSSVQLVAMTENVYRVSGKGKYGKIKGWVSPKSLASQDPNFIENLQKLYQRQLKVNNFIANKQVAIGMTLNEVAQSLGNPTKKESVITKDGTSGT